MGGLHRRKRRSGSRASNINMDRMSDLPEPIRHHIMSFLPFRQVVQTSVLSKAWGRAWRTSPILDFDSTFYDQFLPGFSRLAQFRQEVKLQELRDLLHYIEETLRTRHNETININKFSLFLTRPLLKLYQPYVDRILEYVLDSNVKELNLDGYSGYYFKLPETILCSKSLEKLTLKGSMLESPKNLNFNLSSLRKLCLSYVHIDDMVLENLVSECPLIEYLSLETCRGLGSLELYSLTKLNEVLIFSTGELRWLSIKALNIQKATLQVGCHPDLASCKNLKHLEFLNVDGKNEWLSNQISNFPFLECLILKLCTNIKSFKISSLSLKSFEMSSCGDVVGVDIVAPKLSTFGYVGSVVSFSLDVLSLSECHLLFYYTPKLEPAQYAKYIELLTMFHSISKVVILRSNPGQPLIIPEYLRQTQSFPTCSVDHLDCTLEDVENIPRWRALPIKSVIQSLLWISPHLSTISMRLGPLGSPSRSTLKFKFSYRRQRVYEGEMSESCPSSCWRKCVEEIVIEEGNNPKMYSLKGKKDIEKIGRFVKLHMDRLRDKKD